MANISEFVGTLSFVSESDQPWSDEDYIAAYYVLSNYSIERNEYGFSMDYKVAKTLNTFMEEVKQYGNELSIGIHGNGRWSAASTIGAFDTYVNDKIVQNLSDFEYFTMVDMLKRSMFEKGLKLIFEIIDYEPGVAYLIRDEIEVYVDEYKTINELYFSTNEHLVELYEYTAHNYIVEYEAYNNSSSYYKLAYEHLNKIIRWSNLYHIMYNINTDNSSTAITYNEDAVDFLIDFLYQHDFLHYVVPFAWFGSTEDVHESLYKMFVAELEQSDLEFEWTPYPEGTEWANEANDPYKNRKEIIWTA